MGNAQGKETQVEVVIIDNERHSNGNKKSPSITKEFGKDDDDDDYIIVPKNPTINSSLVDDNEPDKNIIITTTTNDAIELKAIPIKKKESWMTKRLKFIRDRSSQSPPLQRDSNNSPHTTTINDDPTAVSSPSSTTSSSSSFLTPLPSSHNNYDYAQRHTLLVDLLLGNATSTTPSSNTSISSTKSRRALGHTFRRKKSSKKNLDQQHPSTSLSSLTSLSSSQQSSQNLASLLSPHVRLQKDKGKGHPPGTLINATGRDMTIRKLAQKTQLLSKKSRRVSITRSAVTTFSLDCGRQRETRSIVTVTMGFMSLTYGILLRWAVEDNGGCVDLIVLRKMPTEDFGRGVATTAGSVESMPPSAPPPAVDEVLSLEVKNEAASTTTPSPSLLTTLFETATTTLAPLSEEIERLTATTTMTTTTTNNHYESILSGHDTIMNYLINEIFPPIHKPQGHDRPESSSPPSTPDPLSPLLSRHCHLRNERPNHPTKVIVGRDAVVNDLRRTFINRKRRRRRTMTQSLPLVVPQSEPMETRSIVMVTRERGRFGMMTQRGRVRRRTMGVSFQWEEDGEETSGGGGRMMVVTRVVLRKKLTTDLFMPRNDDGGECHDEEETMKRVKKDKVNGEKRRETEEVTTGMEGKMTKGEVRGVQDNNKTAWGDVTKFVNGLMVAWS